METLKNAEGVLHDQYLDIGVVSYCCSFLVEVLMIGWEIRSIQDSC